MTPFDMAQRFIGIKETAGTVNNPVIMAMLRLDAAWPANDEVAWCSAFINFIAWLWRLPRSKNLAARSWLSVGEAIALEEATVDPMTVVILKRGADPQPGPEVVHADGTWPPGHVGLFAGLNSTHVMLLGGNQGDGVSVQSFQRNRVIGVRRIG